MIKVYEWIEEPRIYKICNADGEYLKRIYKLTEYLYLKESAKYRRAEKW